MEYYSAIKKNAIMSFSATRMNEPRDYHTKWSKSDKDRQIPSDSTYMWNLKYDINKYIYKTETNSQT